MSRLAIVLSHPTQYYSPWFRWMGTHTRLDFRVFYLWEFGVTEQRDPQFGARFKWDVDLLSGYDHEFVPNVARDPGTHHFNGLHNPELAERLRAWHPDAVLLFGYAWRTHLGLIRRPPAPFIFRGDSHLIGHSPSWLKRFVLRRLYARFAAVTFVGEANRDYFRAFGVPEARLHFAPHCVDADRFVRDAACLAAARRLRDELDLGGRKVVLFAGKLLPAKQPGELLDAFLRLAPADWALVFVGDGPERATLETRAAAQSGCVVRFLPFANQSEMPSRYALADLFVLPSRGLYETWGLAVNEAMHLGVPCLVSDRVGCQRDLVTEGETGWVFAATEPAALEAALTRALAALDGDTTELRLRIAARIGGYSYAQATRGLQEALQQATATS
ncbi:MAG: glycosyltransferase family 4 protein [Opitutaceae bacterium]|nr:glycosyltransferase family 4 protein [Opitutaceae bacterium]